MEFVTEEQTRVRKMRTARRMEESAALMAARKTVFNLVCQMNADFISLV